MSSQLDDIITSEVIHLGKHYDEALIPDEMRRNFDVYDRISALSIDLGSFEDNVGSLANAGIAGVIVQESGLVYLSGTSGGTLPMNDDADRIEHTADRADHREGRRNLFLRTLDAVGLGFDS